MSVDTITEQQLLLIQTFHTTPPELKNLLGMHHYLPNKTYTSIINQRHYNSDKSWIKLAWPSTTNTHDYLTPIRTGGDYTVNKSLYATSGNTALPNTQVWVKAEFARSIHVNNNCKKQKNAFTVKELLHGENIFTTDGPNQNDTYCFGIQSDNFFRILCLDADNTLNNSGFRHNLKKIVLCREKFKGSLNTLMIFKNENRVLFCGTEKDPSYLDSDTEEDSSYLAIGNIYPEKIDNQYYQFKTSFRQKIAQKMISIGRLKDYCFLGLGENGRFSVITINEQTNTLEVCEKYVRYKPSATQEKKEDFFRLCAVDSCTDRFNSYTAPRDAYSFVVVNKENIVFLAVLKKQFYNSKKRITLRRLPIIDNPEIDFCVKDIKKIWLAHRTISILHINGVVTFDIELSKLAVGQKKENSAFSKLLSQEEITVEEKLTKKYFENNEQKIRIIKAQKEQEDKLVEDIAKEKKLKRNMLCERVEDIVTNEDKRESWLRSIMNIFAREEKKTKKQLDELEKKLAGEEQPDKPVEGIAIIEQKISIIKKQRDHLHKLVEELDAKEHQAKYKLRIKLKAFALQEGQLHKPVKELDAKKRAENKLLELEKKFAGEKELIKKYLRKRVTELAVQKEKEKKELDQLAGEIATEEELAKNELRKRVAEEIAVEELAVAKENLDKLAGEIALEQKKLGKLVAEVAKKEELAKNELRKRVAEVAKKEGNELRKRVAEKIAVKKEVAKKELDQLTGEIAKKEERAKKKLRKRVAEEIAVKKEVAKKELDQLTGEIAKKEKRAKKELDQLTGEIALEQKKLDKLRAAVTKKEKRAKKELDQLVKDLAVKKEVAKKELDQLEGEIALEQKKLDKLVAEEELAKKYNHSFYRIIDYLYHKYSVGIEPFFKKTYSFFAQLFTLLRLS